jgi:hypothetical protein
MHETRVDGCTVAPEDIQMVANLRPGDRVTIVTPHGQKVRGRAVICSGTHAALNLGGKHGRPGVVTPRNVVSVSPAR